MTTRKNRPAVGVSEADVVPARGRMETRQSRSLRSGTPTECWKHSTGAPGDRLTARASERRARPRMTQILTPATGAVTLPRRKAPNR